MKSPLFLANREVLKSNLRLSGSSDCKDIAALIDEAMCAARFRFYRDLGIDCVTQIAAITPEQNPTTEDGLIRDLAELTEVRLVRLELLGIAPMFFTDSSGQVLDTWNEEGFTREANSSEVKQLQECWEVKVREAMDILREKALPDPIVPGRATCRVFNTKPVEDSCADYCC